MIDAVGLRVVLVALAGWVNRHQLKVIEYLREENRILKEHLDGLRLRLTDVQRRRLAVNGHRLGRKTLRDVATLVTPEEGQKVFPVLALVFTAVGVILLIACGNVTSLLLARASGRRKEMAYDRLPAMRRRMGSIAGKNTQRSAGRGWCSP